MAVKTCPECGGKVAGMRNDCPHCKYKFNEQKTKKCPECEAQVPADASECPECGYFFGQNVTSADQGLSFIDDSFLTSAASGGFDEKEALDLKALSAFTFNKRPNGTYEITGLKDKYTIEAAIPDCVSLIQTGAFKGNKYL